MPEELDRTTWDGKPIASHPPYGATVVVYRPTIRDYEYLLLHRSHEGPDHEGDWAWTPPSGARFPGEEILECASRELMEETGLQLRVDPIQRGNEEWAVFTALLSRPARIRLSKEHDRYEWVSLKQALAICKPARVGQGILDAAEVLALRLSEQSDTK